MSRKYKIRDQDKLYFVTFTVIEWIDLFTRKEYRDVVLESLKYCKINKGLEIWAYCIMSSHIHFILGRNGDQPLEGIIGDKNTFQMETR
jgi:putative transposase